jgi:hypothetical protein
VNVVVQSHTEKNANNPTTPLDSNLGDTASDLGGGDVREQCRHGAPAPRLPHQRAGQFNNWVSKLGIKSHLLLPTADGQGD